MATITKEKIEKINEGLGNGFQLDVMHFLTWNEKQATKRVKLSSKTWAKFTLTFYPEYESTHGYNMRTGKYYPVLWINKEVETGPNFLSSYGLGTKIKLGEAQNRKMFSKLQKISKSIDINNYMSIAAGEPETVEESAPVFG